VVYATGPKSHDQIREFQLHLDSGTTDKLGLANITVQKAEPTSTHSIRHEIEKHLERYVDEKTREVGTRLPGRFVQEFEVQAPARAVRDKRVGIGSLLVARRALSRAPVTVAAFESCIQYPLSRQSRARVVSSNTMPARPLFMLLPINGSNSPFKQRSANERVLEQLPATCALFVPAYDLRAQV
jgi:hypothetical protein